MSTMELMERVVALGQDADEDWYIPSDGDLELVKSGPLRAALVRGVTVREAKQLMTMEVHRESGSEEEKRDAKRLEDALVHVHNDVDLWNIVWNARWTRGKRPVPKDPQAEKIYDPTMQLEDVRFIPASSGAVLVPVLNALARARMLWWMSVDPDAVLPDKRVVAWTPIVQVELRVNEPSQIEGSLTWNLGSVDLFSHHALVVPQRVEIIDGKEVIVDAPTPALSPPWFAPSGAPLLNFFCVRDAASGDAIYTCPIDSFFLKNEPRGKGRKTEITKYKRYSTFLERAREWHIWARGTTRAYTFMYGVKMSVQLLASVALYWNALCNTSLNYVNEIAQATDPEQPELLTRFDLLFSVDRMIMRAVRLSHMGGHQLAVLGVVASTVFHMVHKSNARYKVVKIENHIVYDGAEYLDFASFWPVMDQRAFNDALEPVASDGSGRSIIDSESPRYWLWQALENPVNASLPQVYDFLRVVWRTPSRVDPTANGVRIRLLRMMVPHADPAIVEARLSSAGVEGFVYETMRDMWNDAAKQVWDATSGNADSRETAQLLRSIETTSKREMFMFAKFLMGLQAQNPNIRAGVLQVVDNFDPINTLNEVSAHARADIVQILVDAIIQEVALEVEHATKGLERETMNQFLTAATSERCPLYEQVLYACYQDKRYWAADLLMRAGAYDVKVLYALQNRLEFAQYVMGLVIDGTRSRRFALAFVKTYRVRDWMLERIESFDQILEFATTELTMAELGINWFVEHYEFWRSQLRHYNEGEEPKGDALARAIHSRFVLDHMLLFAVHLDRKRLDTLPMHDLVRILLSAYLQQQLGVQLDKSEGALEQAREYMQATYGDEEHPSLHDAARTVMYVHLTQVSERDALSMYNWARVFLLAHEDEALEAIARDIQMRELNINENEAVAAVAGRGTKGDTPEARMVLSNNPGTDERLNRRMEVDVEYY